LRSLQRNTLFSEVYRGNNILDESNQEGDDDDDPSWWDEESILVSIDLGLDEGGDNGDNLIVSVQVGVTHQAKRLKQLWRQRLPKELPYFHSKDFGNYAGGVFTKAGLDRLQRHELLSDLCRITHDRLLCGLAVRVKISEYNRLTTQDFRSRQGTAYSFAVDLCLLFAYQTAKQRGMTPEFNVLIEDGHRNANQAAQILTRIKNYPALVLRYYKDDYITDLRILSAGLGEKKDHPILQSADMLAYAEFQRDTQRDSSIWDALNKRDAAYRAYELRCDEELIKAFVDEGSKETIQVRWRKAKELYEAEQRVQEIQSDNEYDPPSRSKSGESCDGGGKESQRGKAEG
jgi:hypothetical protein